VGCVGFAGGRWSCAAFSAKFEDDAALVSDEQLARERADAERAEVVGQQIFEAWLDLIRHAKARCTSAGPSDRSSRCSGGESGGESGESGGSARANATAIKGASNCRNTRSSSDNGCDVGGGKTWDLKAAAVSETNLSLAAELVPVSITILTRSNLPSASWDPHTGIVVPLAAVPVGSVRPELATAVENCVDQRPAAEPPTSASTSTSSPPALPLHVPLLNPPPATGAPVSASASLPAMAELGLVPP
jgi:hypothetical protein